MRRLTPGARRAAASTEAAVLGLGGALAVWAGLPGDSTSARPVPLADAATPTPVPTGAEPSAAPAAAAAATPAWTPPALYTSSSPVHLEIPSVGLDLPLLAHVPRDGVIDPPTLTAGYWIEPYGEPVGTADEADNTLYLAAHSAGYGDDGFDPLLTADHRGSALAPGDVVSVRTPRGSVDYTVEEVRRYGKDELPRAEEIWVASPGRLVLITCFQRADGRASTENPVVVAES